MTSVAICIPTHNQEHFLATAVKSATGNRLSCETWISDDASTDNTPIVMEELKKQFPNIISFRQEKNLGIQGNPTWVMKQPDTEFIIRLDSDDALHPDYAEKLVVALKAYPQAGYAHVAVQEMDENGQKQKLRLLSRNTGFQSGEESLRASVTGYRVAANICMFRRAALQQIKYYRNLSFAEDWDLAVRLADAGWGNVYVNEILASYRVWDAPVRSRRKLAEVEGCRRVMEDSLMPAFTRRGWDADPIRISRRQLALRHAECLRSDAFTETDREELRQALCQLGDSAALRRKFRWIRTPIAPLFQLPASIIQNIKCWGKQAIYGRTRQ